MKLSIAKLFMFASLTAGISVAGLVVWQLLFKFKEQTYYDWGVFAADAQTLQVVCGKFTFYYRSTQNPNRSMPVSYREQAVDIKYCSHLSPPVQRFPWIVNPKQQCQQIEPLKWRCQGDLVPALYNRQQKQP